MRLIEASIFIFLAGAVFAKHHHDNPPVNVPAASEAPKQEQPKLPPSVAGMSMTQPPAPQASESPVPAVATQPASQATAVIQPVTSAATQAPVPATTVSDQPSLTTSHHHHHHHDAATSENATSAAPPVAATKAPASAAAASPLPSPRSKGNPPAGTTTGSHVSTTQANATDNSTASGETVLASESADDDKYAAKINACCLGACVDQTPLCLFWASHGECKKNKGWMIPNCPASCGSCSQKQITFRPCADLDKDCVKWSSEGECTKNKHYMIWKCPKVCAFCSNNGTNPYPKGL